MRVMRVMGMLWLVVMRRRLRLRLLVVDILLKMLLLWMMLRIMLSLFLILHALLLLLLLLVLGVGVPVRRGVHADDWLQGSAAFLQQTRMVVVVVTGLVVMAFVTLTFTLIMIILILLLFGVDLAVLAGAVVLLKVGDPVWILVSAGFGCSICRTFSGAVAVLIT